MKKGNYRLSKSAENDLLEIWDYTAHTWGQPQAERYLKKLEVRFFTLAAKTITDQPRNDLAPGYFSYHEARHLIIYRLDEEGIAIARILHERMDLAERLEEDPGLDLPCFTAWKELVSVHLGSGMVKEVSAMIWKSVTRQTIPCTHYPPPKDQTPCN